MTPIKKLAYLKQRLVHLKSQGAVLIISMIFVLIFSAMAVSMATLSSTNTQLASNQHKVGCALASAESGLEVMRFWLSRVTIPNSTPSYQYFSTIAYNLHDDLTANGISNIAVDNDGAIQPVTLDSGSGQTFNGRILIDPNYPNVLQVCATGGSGQITRTIEVYYDIEPYEYPIFDFGMATKGPLHFMGSPTLIGVNSDSEAEIFIESQNDNLALLATGNVNFDGDISIANPNANVDLQGSVLIGGDSGQSAIDNHIFNGAELAEFPTPDTGHFQQYATGDTIDSSTDTSNSMTLTNATIAAGTNPSFGGNVTIEGILFIEPPNIVTFEGNVDVRGMIVADGDPNNPGTNNVTFLGNFQSGSFPEDTQFDAIRCEAGSSILAPGFAASFQGNFSAIGGVMAVSGAEFSGNISATIKGTIINYSDSPTTIWGNATLNFDRSDDFQVPAGFNLLRALTYDPDSYSEIPQ
ncbi:MAG: PilX N-terminal domain-containing pilus assembly protein [Planctomycetota bacterium]